MWLTLISAFTSWRPCPVKEIILLFATIHIGKKNFIIKVEDVSTESKDSLLASCWRLDHSGHNSNMLEYFSRSCFIWWPVASPEMLMFTMEEVFHLDWGSIVNFLLKTKWMNWILRAVSTSNCYKGNQCWSPRFQKQSSAPLTPKFINTRVAILTPALKMRSNSSWHQHLLVVMLLTAMLFF